MKALLQRVTEASVRVADTEIGRIGPGLLVLVCAMRGDTAEQADALAARIAKQRIFRDEQDKMNLSLKDVGGSVLVVSQFTLAADTSRGTRPGFSAAAPVDEGRALYERFCTAMAEHAPVETGRFGADMQVSLVNSGPVTIWVEA
ncbi:D-aminoacyl-tRNA deacylase [Falsirhodobacter sp. alg1]|uniref:D-aminoacyl-tRNA deacylase n=1 Tax=Falsirhodobacter sp. alg1 TaxID=1472418 RepID=UPI0005EFBAB2|nr:D-aminoacyl-tRNA deacylase [Falsirhodobacter sp. alg1]